MKINGTLLFLEARKWFFVSIFYVNILLFCENRLVPNLIPEKNQNVGTKKVLSKFWKIGHFVPVHNFQIFQSEMSPTPTPRRLKIDLPEWFLISNKMAINFSKVQVFNFFRNQIWDLPILMRTCTCTMVLIILPIL